MLAFGLVGLWAFANLEVGKALLRVEERWRAFLAATVFNVVLTVVLTVTLVVIRDDGARGLVAGNFVASAVTVVALWVALRRYVGFLPGRGTLAPLLAFGLPTVPADAAAFALNVIDRAYLLRTDSAGAAGRYSLSVKVASVVIVAVRGFQYAWPPLAYSVTDDEEAVYAVVAGAGGPAARLQDHPQLRVLHGLRAEVAYYSPGAHEREEAGRLDAWPGVRGGHGATSWTWFPALSRRRWKTSPAAL